MKIVAFVGCGIGAIVTAVIAWYIVQLVQLLVWYADEWEGEELALIILLALLAGAVLAIITVVLVVKDLVGLMVT